MPPEKILGWGCPSCGEKDNILIKPTIKLVRYLCRECGHRWEEIPIQINEEGEWNG